MREGETKSLKDSKRKKCFIVFIFSPFLFSQLDASLVKGSIMGLGLIERDEHQMDFNSRKFRVM